ncbi:hypothetical protein CAOG_08957 [Capsaspora owczarzaki ATCC 30864]|uniref:Peptidase A1 domain-containing protein n=1 Tax=Capsaspora owczarzaki (strain ATCC 30864) TaxID=595528 RepID=A0A0D2WUT7_CAPO3|nr:hypothetical protein CAOG_08957 [Capsaspora owczarzaki ATCC 30864]KJE95793.1 hypothetical protein CAOG_008957 [Capsaspora owczarzaki ATCC 30864]|eukprot:XP_011270628.1 hypothetical protein CAOG_08957 [Capsaspora owczarzaki ATCC 30864]
MLLSGCGGVRDELLLRLVRAHTTSAGVARSYRTAAPAAGTAAAAAPAAAAAAGSSRTCFLGGGNNGKGRAGDRAPLQPRQTAAAPGDEHCRARAVPRPSAMQIHGLQEGLLNPSMLAGGASVALSAVTQPRARAARSSLSSLPFGLGLAAFGCSFSSIATHGASVAAAQSRKEAASVATKKAKAKAKEAATKPVPAGLSSSDSTTAGDEEASDQPNARRAKSRKTGAATTSQSTGAKTNATKAPATKPASLSRSDSTTAAAAAAAAAGDKTDGAPRPKSPEASATVEVAPQPASSSSPTGALRPVMQPNRVNRAIREARAGGDPAALAIVEDKKRRARSQAIRSRLHSTISGFTTSRTVLKRTFLAPEARLKCPECSNTYAQGFLLKLHILNEHRPHTIKCFHCEFTAGHLTTLHSHIRRNHATLLECPYCTASFSKLTHAESHISACHLQTLHQCEICEYTTNLGHRAVFNHMRIAHSFSLRCHVCGVICHSPELLVQHIEHKHNETMWGNRAQRSCEVCDEVFVFEPQLAGHMRDKHPETAIQCPDCHHVAYGETELQRHKVYVHGPEGVSSINESLITPPEKQPAGYRTKLSRRQFLLQQLEAAGAQQSAAAALQVELDQAELDRDEPAQVHLLQPQSLISTYARARDCRNAAPFNLSIDDGRPSVARAALLRRRHHSAAAAAVAAPAPAPVNEIDKAAAVPADRQQQRGAEPRAEHGAKPVLLLDPPLPPLTVLPLHGNGLLGYTVTATVQTAIGPSDDDLDRFELLVDTGSTSLAVSGSDCCGPYVTPGVNWRSSRVLGHAKMRYGFEGARSGWDGVVIQSRVSLLDAMGTPAAAAQMPVAVITAEQDFFAEAKVKTRSHMNGILGLAYHVMGSKYNDKDDDDDDDDDEHDAEHKSTKYRLDSFVAAAVSTPNSNVSADVFSMQLCATGGEMILGGIKPDAISSPVYHVPVVSKTLFFVRMLDMLVGAQRIGVKPESFMAPGVASGAIVDSGTTYLTLSSAAFSALVAKVKLGVCASCTANSSDAVCTVVCKPKSTFFSGTVDGRVAVPLNPCAWPDITIIIESHEGNAAATHIALVDAVEQHFAYAGVPITKPLDIPRAANQSARLPQTAIALTVPAFSYLHCKQDCSSGTCTCALDAATKLPLYSFSVQDSGEHGVSVLGNTFMEPFVTLFDKQLHRVGFAIKSACRTIDTVCPARAASAIGLVEGATAYTYEFDDDDDEDEEQEKIVTSMLSLVAVVLVCGLVATGVSAWRTNRQHSEEATTTTTTTTTTPVQVPQRRAESSLPNDEEANSRLLSDTDDDADEDTAFRDDSGNQAFALREIRPSAT